MKPERNYRRSSARSRDFARPLTALTVAATAITVLFLSGCASSRKAATSSRNEESGKAEYIMRDSASMETIVERHAVTVPEETVRLTIATDSLSRLPSGASYNSRRGRASVKVGRIAATESEPERIYVESTCDSLLVQCERYERRIREQSRTIGKMISAAKRMATEQEIRKNANGIGTALKWSLIGLLTGIILGALTSRKINKKLNN